MTARTFAGMILLLALSGWGRAAPAAEVLVRWEPVSQDVEGAAETISHYLLHMGRSPRPTDVVHSGDGSFRYERVVNAGPVTEHRFEDLKPATWFFAVTAVDTEGNPSAYSTEFRLGIPDEQRQVPEPRPTPPRPALGQAKPAAQGGGCASVGGQDGWAGLLGLGFAFGLRRRWLGRDVQGPGAGAIGRPRQA